MVKSTLIFAKYRQAGLLTDENLPSAHVDLVGFFVHPRGIHVVDKARLTAVPQLLHSPGVCYIKNSDI
jgi:hypothetical protein